MDRDRRSSGRFSKKIPVSYDEQGWEIPDTSVMRQAIAFSSPSPPASWTPEPKLNPASIKPKSSGRAKHDPNHILRPKNPFFQFRCDFDKACRRMNSCLGQQEISKQAGIAWGKLTKEEQLSYTIRAEKEKKEHRAKYPDYVYSPASRSSKPNPTVRSGGITKKRCKQHTRNQDEKSRSPSRFPTRLSPESASPVPQTELNVMEIPQSKFAADIKSESPPPVDLKLDWTPAPTENIPVLKLEVPKLEKPLDFDLSLRPPSYDNIDAPLGFKPTITPIEDIFFPTMQSSSTDSDTDINFQLFTQVAELPMLSFAPPPIHLEWDFQQIMLSHNDDDYTRIFFDEAYTPESEETVFAAASNTITMSPVIRSSSTIAIAEEAEMSKYVDFDYDG